jgi:hypothetical protein
MKLECASFTDTNFYSLIERMQGIADLYIKRGDEIISMTTASPSEGIYYGAIFFKEKE